MLDRRTVLASGLAAAALRSTNAFAASRSFPRDFRWGVATAGHQIEGNNVSSDMWFIEHSKPTIFVEPSGDACNSLELWSTDLDLVKSLGLNTYRFSLEWSRIEPEEGQFSPAMLDQYKRIIAGCLSRRLTPFVTFNHFTTPLWFAANGGWTNSAAPELFARFCDRTIRHLGEGIGYAATLNEPNAVRLVPDLMPKQYEQVVRNCYAAAAKAKGVAKFTLSQMVLSEDSDVTTTNMIRGHKLGRAAIKSVRPDLPVGVTLSIQDEAAQGAPTLRDQKRKRYYGEWLAAAKGDDFLGVQTYFRNVWAPDGKVNEAPSGRLNGDKEVVHPEALGNTVRYAHEQTGCPIFVTEHGVQTPDDSVRAWLIPEALKSLKGAMDEGVPVIGYLHWSLLDNFEWMIGYRHQYGLVAVDRKSFKRTAKPSASVFGAIAGRNSL